MSDYIVTVSVAIKVHAEHRVPNSEAEQAANKALDIVTDSIMLPGTRIVESDQDVIGVRSAGNDPLKRSN
jgi:hypothetical protein